MKILKCDARAYWKMKEAALWAEINGLDPAVTALNAVLPYKYEPIIGEKIKVVVCLKSNPVRWAGQAYLENQSDAG